MFQNFIFVLKFICFIFILNFRNNEPFFLQKNSPNISSSSHNTDDLLSFTPLNSLSNELNRENQSTPTDQNSLNLDQNPQSFDGNISESHLQTEDAFKDIEDTSSSPSAEGAEKNLSDTNCV